MLRDKRFFGSFSEVKKKPKTCALKIIPKTTFQKEKKKEEEM